MLGLNGLEANISATLGHCHVHDLLFFFFLIFQQSIGILIPEPAIKAEDNADPSKLIHYSVVSSGTTFFF